MKTISMKQLRQKFGPIRKALERSEQFLLTYRSKPLAVIRPYSAETDAKYLNNQSIYTDKNDYRPINLDKLPDPKTVSFGSKIDSGSKHLPSKPTPLIPTGLPAKLLTEPLTKFSAKSPTKPLDKLGVKKAFV